ncbi:MAG: Crp/Fnr family transcriptional regulator [Chloroflexi bacterium]|nr:Crp/Fnr family transcriptional regulator [Chloroflexota bacterium]
MSDLAKKLGQTQVFNRLPPADCATLARLARRRALAPSEYLCHQGEVWAHALYLVSGQLRWTMLSPAGREFMLYSIDPGRVFWGHSLFDDQPMPASLQAVGASEVALWHRDAILPILDRNPAIWHAIARELVATMRRAREIIYGLAFQPVAGRLAKLLLTQFPAQEKKSHERSITLAEIAARVASTPEVISRVLHQFQAEGVLDITRASITLHDRAALERIVETVDKTRRG